MALLCIQPPLLEPVAITELKDMLRLDQGDTSQDDVLMTLNAAARSWCETITQRRFVQQTWALYMDFFPGYVDLKCAGQRVSSPFVSGSNALLVGIRYAIALPYPPVQAVDTFTYQDANGLVTSMIVGPTAIASVTNNNSQPVMILTSGPHHLLSGASITIAGNSSLLALLNGVANQVVTSYNDTTLIINGVNGTGTSITSTGSVTGYNFVEDVLSQPARLTPVFGQVWPVARVTTNAVEVDYTVGYATPIQVTTTAATATLGTATFTNANIGQPISIPGAGKNGGCLNTIIKSVSGGVGSVRDLPQTTISVPTSALIVSNGTPAHWELIRAAIKFLVNAWFVNRMPSFDAATRDCIAAVLGPCTDKRL